MFPPPDFSKAFEHENNFYLSCETSRFSKLLVHYELYKRALTVPGAIVECGVFKGASFVRWAAFRDLLEHHSSRKLIGFDMFGAFPETDFEADKKYREHFVTNAGESGISVEDLRTVLTHKRLNHQVDLVAGDVAQTIPTYLAENSALRIALLNLDTDIYEPAVAILEHLYPRLVPGGILVIDDYAVFPGETKAVDDYFRGRDVAIQKFPFAATPSFVIKPFEV